LAEAAGLADPTGLPDLRGAAAEDVLRWAVDEFFPDIAVACSMQDAVVVDLACRIEPRIEVFFLETGFHFAETLATAERVRERYPLPVVTLKPAPGAAVYSNDGVEACCRDRKVRPMERYLAGKRAWVSGLRRDESPSRANAQPVEWDAARGLVKVNPIVAWSDDDVERYCARHNVIRNPLRERGYASIGCWPCTLPGKGRDGRWASTGKLECGLHDARPVPGPAAAQGSKANGSSGSNGCNRSNGSNGEAAG
jgi:phosphoadenosine phosphosulfate reductase